MTTVNVYYKEQKFVCVNVTYPLYRKRSVMVNDYMDEDVFERVMPKKTLRVIRRKAVMDDEHYTVTSGTTDWHTDNPYYDHLLGRGGHAMTEVEFLHEYMQAIACFDQTQSSHE